MVPYENEDVINTMNYSKVYFLVYSSLFSHRHVHMCIDGLYLKDFSPLMPEFCVKYLDFPKLTGVYMIYQDWSSLLWCTCGYLYVNDFITVGFILP